MKIISWILIGLILLAAVMAAMDMCSDFPKENIDCIMLTPNIICSAMTNYTIMNPSGVLIENKNMSVWNGTQYSFIFNKPKGSYMIELCNNATREVFVGTSELDDTMGNLGILVALIGFMFWLIYTAKTLNTSDDRGSPILINSGIKLILYGLAGFACFTLIQIAYGFDMTNSSMTTMYNFMLTVGTILLILVGTGTFFNWGYKAVEWVRERFQQR